MFLADTLIHSCLSCFSPWLPALPSLHLFRSASLFSLTVSLRRLQQQAERLAERHKVEAERLVAQSQYLKAKTAEYEKTDRVHPISCFGMRAACVILRFFRLGEERAIHTKWWRPSRAAGN